MKYNIFLNMVSTYLCNEYRLISKEYSQPQLVYQRCWVYLIINLRMELDLYEALVTRNFSMNSAKR
jgi:hypothetical protein